MSYFICFEYRKFLTADIAIAAMVKPNFNGTESCLFALQGSHTAQQTNINTPDIIASTNTACKC